MPSSRSRWRSDRSAEAPCAASTWNQIPCSAQKEPSARRSSKRPVLVAHAGATSASGLRPARCAALERLPEPIGADPLELVDVERDHRVLAEPEDGRRAPDRVVRRGRGEQGEVARRPLAPGLRRDPCAGGEQRREVRERPAAGEHTAGRVAIEADLAEHPAHHLALDRRARGPHLVDRHRIVRGAVDQVGDRRPRRGHGHLVGHRAGVVKAHGRVEVARQPLLEGGRVHPSLLDPARQLELCGQRIRVRLDVDRPAPAAGLGDVTRQELDGRVGSIGVVVHGTQVCALGQRLW